MAGERLTKGAWTLIGNGRGGSPTIGRNVNLYAGSKAIGAIVIGDDAQISANAVADQDVPPRHNCYAAKPVIVRRKSKFGERA